MDRARAADLIERVEAAACAAGAETARERLRRTAEEGVGQNVVGRAEVGVIEDVEEVRPEVEIQLLRPGGTMASA